MRRIFPFLAILLLFLPVNFTVGYFGGKPLDLVPSDFLFLLLPLVLFYLGRLNTSGLAKTYTVALVVYLLYCIVVVFAAQLLGDGGLLSLASFVRSARSFLLFYVGFMVFHWSRGRAERWAIYGAAALPIVLLVSDIVFNSRFPNPRWGGYFFSLDVYGFPNSPGFFYVVAFTMLLVAAVKKTGPRPLFASSAILMAAIIVFVGSRNAILSLATAVALLLYLKQIDRRYLFVFIPVIAIGVYITLSSDVNVGILASKARRSVEEGLLYGRLGVWKDVLSFVAEKPLFGYGFEPLTANYAYHGTAHNQYIEYLYKTGVVGTVLIGIVWFYVFRTFYLASKHPAGGQERWFYSGLMVAFLASLVSNFAQPNLSYTVTQSLFVFCGGLAAARVRKCNRELLER